MYTDGYMKVYTAGELETGILLTDEPLIILGEGWIWDKRNIRLFLKKKKEKYRLLQEKEDSAKTFFAYQCSIELTLN